MYSRVCTEYSAHAAGTDECAVRRTPLACTYQAFGLTLKWEEWTNAIFVNTTHLSFTLSPFPSSFVASFRIQDPGWSRGLSWQKNAPRDPSQAWKLHQGVGGRRGTWARWGRATSGKGNKSTILMIETSKLVIKAAARREKGKACGSKMKRTKQRN